MRHIEQVASGIDGEQIEEPDPRVGFTRHLNIAQGGKRKMDGRGIPTSGKPQLGQQDDGDQGLADDPMLVHQLGAVNSKEDA
jgi:hypothetical protein